MELYHLIARADLCELLSAAFRFPSEELAQALLEGSLKEDMISCLKEVGAGEKDRNELEKRFAQTESSRTSKDIFTGMKREYSRLYLAPGSRREIYPYEGAFCFVQHGGEGLPSLFLTPPAIDVEKQMREARVLPKDARKEPVDSIFNEFEFMMYLYAQLASASKENSEDEIALWSARIQSFSEDHAQKWIPSFMNETKARTRLEVYALLADSALLAGTFLFDKKGKALA